MNRQGKAPRIALISATQAAIRPAVAGLAEQFPQAEVWNILDDTLLPDIESAGALTSELDQRMRRLIEHAVAGGADGVLLTCSQYGPVVAGVQSTVPVYAPDYAAFQAIITGGYTSVLVIASIDTSLSDSMSRLSDEIARAGATVQLTGCVASAARGASDEAILARALIDAARPLMDRIDGIFLAQFSLTAAAEALEKELGVPVVTGPGTAASLLRSAIESS